MSKSLAWQAAVSCSWRDMRAQPPYTPREGGWAGSLLPSRASCLLPASTAPKARAVWGLGGSQHAGRRQPCPLAPPAPLTSYAHPSLNTNCHLGLYTSPPSIHAPRLAHTHSLLCCLWASPPSPLCTPTFKHAFFWALVLHLHHFGALGPFVPLRPWLKVLAHTQLHAHTYLHIQDLGPQFQSKDLSLHFSALCIRTLLNTPGFWFLVSWHPPNHVSTLINTLEYPLSPQDLTSR